MSTRDELAAFLESEHFDGTGCGTNGSGACSYCYGPSPMTAEEVAEAVRPWLAEHDRVVAANAWDEGWKAAQEIMDLNGEKVWAHTVIEEGYEPNPYRKETP